MKKELTVVDVKKHFSEVIGTVAYKKEPVIVTKRGNPVVEIVPISKTKAILGAVNGWLEPNDDFFEIMDNIVSGREKHIPRVIKK